MSTSDPRKDHLPGIGRSDGLGRYYSKHIIGALLVKQMTEALPSCILDLGAGTGILARAAADRWTAAKVVTVDIDQSSRVRLRRLMSDTTKHVHIRADALDVRLPERIRRKAPAVDTAICNPPFLMPTWRKSFGPILEDAGLNGCVPLRGGSIDAALMFLAQNLRVLSATGTLGIVLPDSLASASKYKPFRQHLLSRYFVHRAIRLPRSSFCNTDALAHILIVSKGTPRTGLISLQALTRAGEQTTELLVDSDQAALRLDYAFHSASNRRPPKRGSACRLRDVCEGLFRGSIESAERKIIPFPVLHTSDLRAPTTSSWNTFSQFDVRTRIEGSRRIVQASPGDILLARVGRHLEKQIVGVLAGNPIITDCIYRLRVIREFREETLKQLVGTNGQRWLQTRCYGVSAKQLTKADLLDFPLVFSGVLAERLREIREKSNGGV